jgi:lysophospholipase L1-like esterase
MPATGVSGIDLYMRNKEGRFSFLVNGRPEAQTNQKTFHLPGGSSEYEIYLPLYNGIKELKLGVPVGAKLSGLPKRQEQKTIVFYGTSITQGGCASRPGLAWPTIVSRMLGVNGINLGFSGSGLMEPELADLLNEINADVYVLDCLWNMTPEMVRERVEPFVKKLRSLHPNTAILLAEDSHLRDMPGIKGELLSVVYARLVSAGDKNLYYLANTGMLSADGEGTVDGCHPNDLGMMRHAEVFSAALRRILAKE